MNASNFSLVHLARVPRNSSSSPTTPPPLLLLLHGIGSNEADLFGLAPFLDERFLIVSARAPVVMGAGAYGWFNIEFTPGGMVADLEQAQRSLDLLPGFLDEIVTHYGANERCVYVAGFSQGAMMSLALALNWPEKIAGVVAMSGRFPSQALKDELDEERLKGMPFMVTHGIYDPVLPIGEGRNVRKNLEELPVELTYREYPMGHEVNQDSLRDVTAWLSRSLDSTCDSR
jgi:phospholipase/carboxylesterase